MYPLHHKDVVSISLPADELGMGTAMANLVLGDASMAPAVKEELAAKVSS